MNLKNSILNIKKSLVFPLFLLSKINKSLKYLVISKKEYNITKQSILRNLPNQFETLRQIIRQISNITLFNLDLNYYSKLPDEVNNLSIEEVIEVGEKRILSDQIKLLIVGDYEKISSGINNLGLPVEKIDYNGNPI